VSRGQKPCSEVPRRTVCDGDDEGDFEGVSDPSYHIPPELRMSSLNRKHVLAIMHAGRHPMRYHSDILPKHGLYPITVMVCRTTCMFPSGRKLLHCNAEWTGVCFAPNPTPIWLTRVRYRRTDSSPLYTLWTGYRQVHKRGVSAGSNDQRSSLALYPQKVSPCHPDPNKNGGYMRSKPLNHSFVSHTDLLMLWVSFHSELDSLGYGHALL